MERFTNWYDRIILDPTLRAFYGDSRYFNVGYWTPEITSAAQAGNNLVARLIEGLPLGSGRILDAGCGLGQTSHQLSALRPESEIIGINISHAQAQSCRHTAPDIPFVTMDAARLGFEDEVFDAVISVEAAFHFDTRKKFFAEACRVLEPGGLLALSDVRLDSGRLARAWGVPPENLVDDLGDYYAGLVESGFERVEIQEATRPCWAAFWSRFEIWLEEQARSGDLARAESKMWTELLSDLQNESAAAYLLVTARKKGMIRR